MGSKLILRVYQSNGTRLNWIKWREESRVLCDKKIPMRLKDKFYKRVVRPVMLYGLVLGGV